MSMPSNQNGDLSERERTQAWYVHMREVLAQDPTNHGMTVLMRNRGKTHRFVIPIAPIPTISNQNSQSSQKGKKE